MRTIVIRTIVISKTTVSLKIMSTDCSVLCIIPGDALHIKAIYDIMPLNALFLFYIFFN